MESKKLNGYKIEFYSEEEYEQHKIDVLEGKYEWKDLKDVVVHGLVSDISEDLAEKIVDSTDWFGKNNKSYRDYNNDLILKDTAKQSFQTISKLSYCVITKIE